MRSSYFKLNSKTITSILLVSFSAIFLLQTVSCSSDKKVNNENSDSTFKEIADFYTVERVWTAPDTSTIPKGEEGKLIWYGRRLIIHTSSYFGPKGSIGKSSNGLNCQNCHLEVGTRPYGNNLGAASTIYPKYLPRSGSVVSLSEKINECFSRSLNGEKIDTLSKEMQAYIAYLKWLGKDFNKVENLTGSRGIQAPKLIDRAADPAKGKLAYEQYCSRCHGKDGQGQYAVDVLKDESKQQGGTATAEDLYYYPPLWGEHSFNGIATLYRLSKMAGFIKNNMPYPTTYKTAILTDEEAWDIAAFINSSERPINDHSKDYSVDISKKPYDFPFAPYTDNFSETQHKFGPYTEMPSAKKAH